MHTFLLRHVYASSISSYKLSRQSAMFFTFLLSAAVHELVMAIVTKKIRCVLSPPTPRAHVLTRVPFAVC